MRFAFEKKCFFGPFFYFIFLWLFAVPVGWMEGGFNISLWMILVYHCLFSFFEVWYERWFSTPITKLVYIYYSTRFMYLITIQKNCIFKRTSMRMSTYNWFWSILSEANVVFMQEKWYSPFVVHLCIAYLQKKCIADIHQISYIRSLYAMSPNEHVSIYLYAMFCHVCRNLAQ